MDIFKISVPNGIEVGTFDNTTLYIQCSIDAIYPELHSRPFLGCLDLQSKCCWGKNSPLKTDLTPLCTEIYTWPARQDIHSAVTGGLQGYMAFKLRHLVTKHTWMTELSGAKNRIWRTLSYRLQSQHIWAKSHRCTFQEVKSVEKHQTVNITINISWFCPSFSGWSVICAPSDR